MAAKHRTASREAPGLLPRWTTPEPWLELDRVWAAKRLKPHGGSRNALEGRISPDLATQPRA